MKKSFLSFSVFGFIELESVFKSYTKYMYMPTKIIFFFVKQVSTLF